MKSLHRVAEAPGLIAVIVTIQWVIAAGFGANVRSAIGGSMGKYTVLTDGHLLAAVAELYRTHPGLAASYKQTLAGSSLLALVLFTLLAPVIIYRLAAPRPASVIAAAALRGLPAVIAVTLWHLLPRAVLLAIAGAAANSLLQKQAWGLIGIAALALTMGYCTCALDLARCHILLHGARRFHFKTAAEGFLEALRRPVVLARSLVFSFGQWACAASMVAVAIEGAGADSTIWLIRGLALLGVVCGLTRIAVAIEAGRPSARRSRNSRPRNAILKQRSDPAR